MPVKMLNLLPFLCFNPFVILEKPVHIRAVPKAVELP